MRGSRGRDPAAPTRACNLAEPLPPPPPGIRVRGVCGTPWGPPPPSRDPTHRRSSGMRAGGGRASSGSETVAVIGEEALAKAAETAVDLLP